MFNNSLSRADLQWLGITEVSEDGKTIKVGDHDLAQCGNNKGYKNVTICPNTGNCLEKQKKLYVHRVVYAWHKGYIPANMQVDHLSGDRNDNSIENLRLVTNKENSNAFKAKHGTRALACSLKTPREEYEKRLAKYEEELKIVDSSRKASVCTMIQCLKANLRYYDSHIEEYRKEQEEKAKEKAVNDALIAEAKASRKRVAECKKKLRVIATEYRLKGNKQQWHNFMGLLNNFDAVPLEKLEEIADKTITKLGI